MSIAEQDPNAAKVARETAGGDTPRRWLGKSLNRVEDPRFLLGRELENRAHPRVSEVQIRQSLEGSV